MTEKTTHFGFKEVPDEEKAGMVRGVFDSVADRYDLMNDVMSGGVHRLWKDAMVSWLSPRPGSTVLDVAGGTGDIAFRILDRSVRKGPAAKVIVADINEEMLRVGAGRSQTTRKNKAQPLAWVTADAERLPFEDSSVDAYTIAFGIRNVTHIDKALSEAFRVLRRGGRFLCLEFSEVQVPVLDKFYDEFSFRAIPRFGKWITGDAESYQYLVESIRRFPNQKAFAGMIEGAGFSNVKVRNLTGGISAMHSGWKI
jgi:demethylmenaquinone methyltransferase/2-methoxy-6-polyprenyl-1,4-benzoquinol methylase